ncbi:hypothetical protein [Rubripirellula reticaptiva]|uniref:Uncharacterized protein n=1 Tax=Rubripirellula reticaptiva TaxID=2528013 RepID=A0A5C6EP62_9BACT|nr:hypothetical protein [Rubripirellula reticaptiva]TWU51543.1 hypothetical protein Poly59_31350 [Rubripirellula reticaptiva]
MADIPFYLTRVLFPAMISYGLVQSAFMLISSYWKKHSVRYAVVGFFVTWLLLAMYCYLSVHGVLPYRILPVSFFVSVVVVGCTWTLQQSQRQSEENDQPVRLIDADSSPPSGDGPTEVTRRSTIGRSLAILSLLIYFIGLGADVAIVIANRSGAYTGLGPVHAVIFITIVCLVASIGFAIVSCFTYPRALFIQLLHGLTIAGVIRLSQWGSEPW